MCNFEKPYVLREAFATATLFIYKVLGASP